MLSGNPLPATGDGKGLPPGSQGNRMKELLDFY